MLPNSTAIIQKSPESATTLQLDPTTHPYYNEDISAIISNLTITHLLLNSIATTNPILSYHCCSTT